mmetsp:Transcript_66764/g.159334  ORF Transcript_66764/g.159334 Transcript_66764/m.159334 type:complete len:308 (-) Transcript_66764:252-1175(-)
MPRALVAQLLRLKQLEEAPGPCQWQGLLIEDHHSTFAADVAHRKVERGLVPILSHFLLHGPLVVAEAAHPVGQMLPNRDAVIAARLGQEGLLRVLADSAHEVAEWRPPVVGDEPSDISGTRQLCVGELEGTRERQDDVVADVVHGPAWTGVPAEEVEELPQLACADGTARSPGASNWFRIVPQQLLDETVDVLAEASARQLPVADSVGDDSYHAANGDVEAAVAGHHPLVADVLVVKQSCVDDAREKGPNQVGHLEHPGAEPSLLRLHLKSSARGLVVLKHRASILLLQDELVVGEVLHFEVVLLRV